MKYSIVKYSKANKPTVVLSTDDYDRKKFNAKFKRETKTLNVGERLELEYRAYQTEHPKIGICFEQRRKDGIAEITNGHFQFTRDKGDN